MNRGNHYNATTDAHGRPYNTAPMHNDAGPSLGNAISSWHGDETVSNRSIISNEQRCHQYLSDSRDQRPIHSNWQGNASSSACSTMTMYSPAVDQMQHDGRSSTSHLSFNYSGPESLVCYHQDNAEEYNRTPSSSINGLQHSIPGLMSSGRHLASHDHLSSTQPNSTPNVSTQYDHDIDFGRCQGRSFLPDVSAFQLSLMVARKLDEARKRSEKCEKDGAELLKSPTELSIQKLKVLKRQPQLYYGDDSMQDSKRQKTAAEKSANTSRSNLLWIGGLGELTEEDLLDYFSRYGKVLKVIFHLPVSSTKFCYIRFHSSDEVTKALQDGSPVQGVSWEAKHTINGQVIACSSTKLDASSCVLYLGSMLKTRTNRTRMRYIMKSFALRKHFGKYGEIVEIRDTWAGDGLLFVKYQTPAQCAEAFRDGLVCKGSQHVISDSIVKCDLERIDDKQQRTSASCKLNVTGLCGKVTAADLGGYFSETYGFIENVTVTHESDFNDGIVQFQSAKQATAAYEDGMLMECWHSIHNVRIQCHAETPPQGFLTLPVNAEAPPVNLSAESDTIAPDNQLPKRSREAKVSSVSKVASCCVLSIYGLDKIKGKALRKYFCKYGDIDSLQGTRVGGPVSVKFRSSDYCAKAMTDGDLRERSEHHIKDDIVECCVLQADDQQDSSASCKLRVTGLSGDVTATDLGNYFSEQYGSIKDVTVTQYSGIVQFESAKQAMTAYEDGIIIESWHCINGKEFKCQEDTVVQQFKLDTNNTELTEKQAKKAARYAIIDEENLGIDKSKGKKTDKRKLWTEEMENKRIANKAARRVKKEPYKPIKIVWDVENDTTSMPQDEDNKEKTAKIADEAAKNTVRIVDRNRYGDKVAKKTARMIDRNIYGVEAAYGKQCNFKEIEEKRKRRNLWTEEMEKQHQARRKARRAKLDEKDPYKAIKIVWNEDDKATATAHQEELNANRLLVHNLKTLTEKQLHNYFISKYGPVKRVRLISCTGYGGSRSIRRSKGTRGIETMDYMSIKRIRYKTPGYGHVVFGSSKQAMTAYQDGLSMGLDKGISQHRIGGIIFECGRNWTNMDNDEQEFDCHLKFDGGIWKSKRETITLFSQFGQVTNCTHDEVSYLFPSQCETVYKNGYILEHGRIHIRYNKDEKLDNMRRRPCKSPNQASTNEDTDKKADTDVDSRIIDNDNEDGCLPAESNTDNLETNSGNFVVKDEWCLEDEPDIADREEEKEHADSLSTHRDIEDFLGDGFCVKDEWHIDD